MTDERLATLIRQLQGMLGGKSVRSGQSTLTFTAAVTSNTVSVTHGLRKVPTEVVATSFNAPAFGNIPTCNAFGYGATSFSLNGEVKTAFTGTVVVSWIARG